MPGERDLDAQRGQRCESTARTSAWPLGRGLLELGELDVTASVTLDHMDRRPVEGAISGLAHAKAEIAKLQRT